MKVPRTLLIDCDVLLYVHASRNEYVTQWDEDLFTLEAHLLPAQAGLDDQVQELQEKLGAEAVIMALTDYTNPWRRAVLPSYKSNRKEKRKPVIYAALREYVHSKYETFQRPGLEGDDVLGILATMPNPPKVVRGERVVCSIDKDMQCIPGVHFNWDKDEERRTVSLGEADRFHMFQTLTGDVTDGYAGCKGVGAVGANKILGETTKSVGDMWPLVVSAYKKAGLGEEAALQQARVARICRAEDYNFEKKEVRLWNPS